MKDKKFFAFISYQRQDEEYAEWLRKKLEHYLPYFRCDHRSADRLSV